MSGRNLRHLRIFLAALDARSITEAARRCHVTQPAATQAVAGLEAASGGALFERTRQGLFPTPRGTALGRRVRRAFALLDPALEALSPRLKVTASAAQLAALAAVAEAENVTLAARRLGRAQPTVHRAVTQLEREAGRALFERTAFGSVPARGARALARATRLAFAELDQAEADLAELGGGQAGRVVVGALPLSRSVILPAALAAFRRARPAQAVTVVDGLYDELLAGLRRGEIDVIVGALRDPAPIDDIVQEPLFEDRLALLAAPAHPLARPGTALAELGSRDWVVPRRGTPARAQFDAVFAGPLAPRSVIETGSILLMREILSLGDHLGCISAAQAQAEVGRGLLARVGPALPWPGRPIGLTTRANWETTAAQALLLDLLREAATAHAAQSAITSA